MRMCARTWTNVRKAIAWRLPLSAGDMVGVREGPVHFENAFLVVF